VYGNAADHPDRERRYPSDMTDAEWAMVRPLLPTPAWLEGRGGQPEGYCHRQMLDQCHEVKNPAAVSSVAGVRRGASAIQGIDQDLPEKAEAQWISLSRAEPMTCSRLVISVS
jgi:transposase